MSSLSRAKRELESRIIGCIEKICSLDRYLEFLSRDMDPELFIEINKQFNENVNLLYIKDWVDKSKKFLEELYKKPNLEKDEKQS